MKKLLFIAGALFALSACAKPLAQSDMAEFAKTADTAAAVIAAPSQIQTRLSSTASDNEARCRYLRGGNVGLAATPANLKPSPLAQEQAKVAAALAAYTKGIVDAADGKGFDDLERGRQGIDQLSWNDRDDDGRIGRFRDCRKRSCRCRPASWRSTARPAHSDNHARSVPGPDHP